MRLSSVAWGVLGFCVYFYIAQFIPNVAWNAIELLIAQHLIDHGSYVTSVDYQSALTWRPVFGTSLVTFVRLWTADPILIYRVVCGLAVGMSAAMLYLAGRRTWGPVAGHAAAFFAVTCPATTLYLIYHVHSYSHLGALVILAPTLFVALSLLKSAENREPASLKVYLGSGLLWGLCYIARSELLLFFAVHFAILTAVHRWRRLSWRPLVSMVLPFALVFAAYNSYAGRVAERDGILIRKSIYPFYISQGWVDPQPDIGPDIEGDGYLYAIKLYGDPKANGESMVRAIAHNPSAFLRRVRINVHNFYARYVDPGFFVPLLSAVIAAVAVLLLGGRIPPADRVGLAFLLGLFLASHFVLILHIDARYLTVNILPLLLVASYGIHYAVQRARRLPRAAFIGVAVVLGGALLYSARPELDRLWHHPGRSPDSLAALESLGEHFRETVPSPVLTVNREPHIDLLLAPGAPVVPEDFFLLAYYSHSAYVNSGADGPFPRGKMYSFRERPPDYRFVPAERMKEPGAVAGGIVINDYINPVLGRYYLVQLNRGP